MYQSVRHHIPENALFISTAVTSSIPHICTHYTPRQLYKFLPSHMPCTTAKVGVEVECPICRDPEYGSFVVWDACASREFRALHSFMKHGKLNPVGKNGSEFPVDLGLKCEEAPSTPTARRDKTKWTRHRWWQ
jgi:hypothetical protein